MKALLCTVGVNTKRRCLARADEGSMYCSFHKAKAMARIAENQRPLPHPRRWPKDDMVRT